MIHPKLKGIPHIYYINLDERPDRKDWMESQFKDLGITNFSRVNASEFLVADFDNWKYDMIHNPDRFPKTSDHLKDLAISINYMRTLKEWIETTDEEYMILTEDDTDFRSVNYWHFDWEYLMNNIPYDWDAIQLMIPVSDELKCYLHPKFLSLGSYTGPFLINRNYVSKLLSLYFVDGKYNFIKKIGRSDIRLKNNITIVEVDGGWGFNGKVYQFPLLTQDPLLDSMQKTHHVQSCQAHKVWWTKFRDKFTLDDFFTYGKSYDTEMTLNLDDYPYDINKL